MALVVRELEKQYSTDQNIINIRMHINISNVNMHPDVNNEL